MKSFTIRLRDHHERIAAKKTKAPHPLAVHNKKQSRELQSMARENPLEALKALRGATHEHQYRRPAPGPLSPDQRPPVHAPNSIINSAGLNDGKGMPLMTRANPASPKPAERRERELLIDGPAPAPSPSWQEKNRKRVSTHGKYQEIKTSFPRPVAKYYSGLNGFKKFLSYWTSLDEEQHSRLVVHLYRKFPVIDRMLTGNKNASIAVFTEKDDHDNNAKCPFEKDSPNLSLLHMFGSGSYKFLLNERGVPNPILTCEVVVEDPSYPPVLDLRELQHTHPQNQSYIDGLRRRNIPLPWDKKKTEEEDDMADSKVVGELTGTVNRLVDRLGSQSPTPSVDAEAIGKGMSIVQNGAAMAMDIVRAGINSQTVQSNPIEMLRAVAELTGAKKGDDAVTVQLMENNSNLQRQIMEMQAEHSRESRDLMMKFFESQKAAAASVPPPKSELEVLEEALKKKKLLEELHGSSRRRSSSDDDDEDEKKEGTGEMLLKNLPTIAAAVTGLVGIVGKAIDGYIAVRTGIPPASMMPPQTYRPQQAVQNAPQPPQEPIRQPEGFGPQESPAALAGAPQMQSPGIPPEIDLNEFAAATEEDQMTILQLLPIIKEMEPAFLAHYYGENTGGDTFAHWIITSGTGANPTQSGRATYDALKEMGAEKLITYLKMYAPIWNRIGKLPSKTAKFLADFMHYDELSAEGDEEGEVNTPPAEPSPAKVSAAPGKKAQA